MHILFINANPTLSTPIEGKDQILEARFAEFSVANLTHTFGTRRYRLSLQAMDSTFQNTNKLVKAIPETKTPKDIIPKI